MDRRTFLGTLVTAVLASPLAEAQRAGSVPSIGALVHGPPVSPEDNVRSPFAQGLVERGWIPGQNVRVEALYSEGKVDRLAELAAELVRRKVDVIWCPGSPSAVAAARATRAIPIVFWGVAFPVELGLASSLRRPGGNVTGVAYSAGPEIVTKLVELVRTVAPRAARLAGLYEDSAIQKVSGEGFRPAELFEPALRQFSIELRRFAVAGPDDLDQVFARIREWRADTIVALGDPATWRERQRIADFAGRHRLPSVFGMKDFALAGGLLSYGPDPAETVRGSTTYIDRILKGAKASDLPIEQPTRFELVVNQRTARALGLTIPESLRLRADQTIE
jgi:putative tryptophan/tyrosine transport system substrate-binding protein